MEEVKDYGAGITVAFIGRAPKIYVTASFPCGKMERSTTRGKPADSERLLRTFAGQDADSLVAGHVSNCETCKAARAADRHPA